MRIHWLRVVLGGFLIEVILAIVLLGGFAAAGVDISKGVSTASAFVIGVGCLVTTFLVVLWLARRIQSHVVMHGFLMGLAATVLYLGLVAGAGQMSNALASYGTVTFVIVNALRLVGGVCGGMACERKRSVRPAMV